MADSRFSSSNSRAGPSVGNYKWIKARYCYCHPPKVAEFRISESINNPQRPYYKCKRCGFFSWVTQEDVCEDMSGNGQGKQGMEGSSGREEMGQDVADLKAILQSFINQTVVFVKMAVIMYFVLLICIMY